MCDLHKNYVRFATEYPKMEHKIATDTLNICVCVCHHIMHTAHAHTNTHHTYMSMQKGGHADICRHMQTCKHSCTHMQTYLHTLASRHAHRCRQTCTHMQASTHTHTHTHTETSRQMQTCTWMQTCRHLQTHADHAHTCNRCCKLNSEETESVKDLQNILTCAVAAGLRSGHRGDGEFGDKFK